MKKMKKTIFILGGLILLAAFNCSEKQVFDSPASEAPPALAKPTPPPDGLVSWWPGDGNALDYLGNNDGTLMNGAGFVRGMVNKAFRFDGVNDYVITGGVGINDLQQLTLETWIMLAGEPGGQPANKIQRFVSVYPHEKAVIRHDGGNDPGQLHFFLNFGKVDYSTWDEYHVLRDIRYPGFYDPPALLTGIFYHVAGTFDGSVMRLYLDGEEVGSQVVDVAANGLIEGEGVYISDPGEPMPGLIDEVSIYNRALASEEIKAIYNAGRWGKRPKNRNE
jgi:hypothetical protein